MSLALLTEKILSIREKKSEAFAKKNAQLRQWYSKVSSLLEINRHNHWPGIISDSRQETLWETIVMMRLISKKVLMFLHRKMAYLLWLVIGLNVNT